MKKIILIALSFITILSSCSKDDIDKRTLSQDKEDFKTYLIDNNIQVLPTLSGLYFIEKESGNDYTIAENDYVNFTYSLKIITGQIIYTDMNLTTQIKKKELISGFYEGLTMMTEGGESELIVPSYLGYGDVKAGNIAENTSLVYNLEIKTVYSERKEKDVLEKYIIENNITKKPISSGTIIIPIISVEGDVIDVNKKVKIVYSGKLLGADKNFDENSSENPMILNDETDYDNLIAGFSDALKRMKVGEKKQVIIPSSQGYKQGKKNNNHIYIIPPYSTLIFEIEIIK